MKRRIIIALCSIMLVLCSISVGFTVAWLTFSTTSNEVTYTVGKVKYKVELITAENEINKLIVPGQSIFSDLEITNESDVDSNLRVRFEITVKDTSNQDVDWTVGTDLDTNQIILANTVKDGENTSEEVVELTNWITKTGEANVNVLYYQVAAGDEIITPGITDISTAFSNVYLNGALVKNAASGYKVNLKVAIEAKQADYVEWGQITSFETTVIVSE